MKTLVDYIVTVHILLGSIYTYVWYAIFDIMATNHGDYEYITQDDVKIILSKCGFITNVVIEDYVVHNASDKMIGFLADYLKLKIFITDTNGVKKNLRFFVKSVSKTNASKANMAKEMNMFQKEMNAYMMPLDIAGIKQWRPKFITNLPEAMVFQDLNAIHFKMRHKHEKFDMAHTLQALRNLANMHASSIVYEENRSKEIQNSYNLISEFQSLTEPAGYKYDDLWYSECKKAALNAIKTYSKYSADSHTMSMIESRWDNIFENALKVSQASSKYRNVISHRDLWNNNILFHYKKLGEELQPDDCVFVDYQATGYQPPAGDVLMLLYCNLDAKFREENLNMFLNYYHQELRSILCNFGISIDNILTKDIFMSSIEEYRIWAAVASACLIQLFWLDDDLTTTVFNDSIQFQEILTKDKSTFVLRTMQTNEDYKMNVLAKAEEIVERFCISLQ